MCFYTNVKNELFLAAIAISMFMALGYMVKMKFYMHFYVFLSFRHAEVEMPFCNFANEFHHFCLKNMCPHLIRHIYIMIVFYTSVII